MVIVVNFQQDFMIESMETFDFIKDMDGAEISRSNVL